MIYLLVAAFFLLVGVGIGCRLMPRRRYNAGVAAGREFAALEHGLPREAVRPAPRPLRFWPRADRKPSPDDDALVTRQATRSHPLAGQF